MALPLNLECPFQNIGSLLAPRSYPTKLRYPRPNHATLRPRRPQPTSRETLKRIHNSTHRNMGETMWLNGWWYLSSILLNLVLFRWTWSANLKPRMLRWVRIAGRPVAIPGDGATRWLLLVHLEKWLVLVLDFMAQYFFTNKCQAFFCKQDCKWCAFRSGNSGSWLFSHWTCLWSTGAT